MTAAAFRTFFVKDGLEEKKAEPVVGGAAEDKEGEEGEEEEPQEDDVAVDCD